MSRTVRVLVSALLMAAGLVVAVRAFGSHGPAADARAQAGVIKQASMYSGTLKAKIDYEIYLPHGYAAATAHYPTIYLLHGRGDSMEAWTREKNDLDTLISTGKIPPMIVVMPDAPWSDRASWYVNSKYTGTDYPGQQVETAFTRDLVKYVDSHYRTVVGRWGRAIGGYSMGGAGALRYVLAHQNLFGSALVLSPAVFTPLPPADDDVRNYGAFGVGSAKFVDSRYQALNYPALLAKLNPDQPVHVFLAVGDKEYVEPNPADAHHDLDFEEAVAYNQLVRTPGVTADWRVLGGGHDWDVWQPAFVEGIENLSGYLSTTKPQVINTSLLGTSGDDWAGGITPRADGTTTTAFAASGSINAQAAVGGLDAVVTQTKPDGSTAWTTEFGSPADERLYGSADTGAGTTTVAGYTNGNADGGHAANSAGDVFVAQLDSAGALRWRTQFGDPTAADRAYAVTSDGSGGVYVAGYTKGSVGGKTNAGDKDALLAHLDHDGTLLWQTEFGGTGEDKTLAMTATADAVYLAGVTSAGMPGTTSIGGTDGWIAAFSATGQQKWVRQVGSAADDLLHGVAIDGAGNIVTAGATNGDAAGPSSGGTDVLDAAFSPNGSQLWTHQFGTAGDDSAAGLVTVHGTVELAGFSTGKFTAQVGGTDVFVATLDGSGAPKATAQFGTAANDGADTFGEADLALAASGSTLWLTGVTYGNSTATRSHGGADVFTYHVAAP